jgi:hypothetical protein
VALAKAGEKRAKMCDDLKATMESLKAKKVKCGSVTEERWGSVTTDLSPRRRQDRALSA